MINLLWQENRRRYDLLKPGLLVVSILVSIFLASPCLGISADSTEVTTVVIPINMLFP